MKKTFKEKVISRFSNIVKRHKMLKYPCLVLLSIILGIYYVIRHFATNGKRYASIAFVVGFFMNSCSFSFAVFAERTGFINAQETYSAVVGDSDVTLAVEKEVNPEDQILIDDDDLDVGYDVTEDIEGVDTYTIDDILENSEAYKSPESRQYEEEDKYVFDSSDWRSG